MNLDEYRKAVIESVACPYDACLAEVDEPCVRVIDCLSENCGLPVPHEHRQIAHYVHDDRSLAFHRCANRALRAWLDDPRIIEYVPIALLADLDQLIADLESGDARFTA
jgi:hypothetical protein